MSPFPTPCKGKSKSQPFAHTFALTGRRRLYADTQGVALGCGLAALSGRSFSRFVRLSCAHASPLFIWLKNAQRFFCILNTLPCRGAGPHNRLLRRQHCSSLCSQSEGHEHVANMASTSGLDFVGFSVLGRHNIRPPHFASKVSYSASPQAFAACSRSAPCSGAAIAILFGQKLRREFSFILNTLPLWMLLYDTHHRLCKGSGHVINEML